MGPFLDLRQDQNDRIFNLALVMTMRDGASGKVGFFTFVVDIRAL